MIDCMNAEKQFFKGGVINSALPRKKAFLSIEDNRSSAIKQCQLKGVMQREVNEFNEKDKAKDAFKTSFVTETHFEEISSRSSGYILSIRETGAESLKRLGDKSKPKSKPKPHSILDKSIKRSRLGSGGDEIQGIPITDIEGFVGYWDAKGTLKGLILAHIPTKKDGTPLTNIARDGSKSYIELEHFQKLQECPNWEQCLYTGDYDLHEVYDGKGKLIPEGKPKAELLNQLNGLTDNPITADENGALKNVPSDAYFQHGDQATYRESVHNEMGDIAVLVPSVAVEETGSLAWFVKNDLWFISHDRGEHAEVRRRIKEKKGIELKTPETWKDDAAFKPEAISSISETETKPYIAPYLGYKSGKQNEMFKFAYTFSPDFDKNVGSSILEVIRKNHADHIPPEEVEAQKAKIAIAKAKAINLIISNYKGIAGGQKQHFKWRVGNITYYYNEKKEYCVKVEDNTIQSFYKESKEKIPATATQI